MRSIYDMDISNYRVKEGDIKVNADEMKRLFELVGEYHFMLSSMLNELSEDEKKILSHGLEFVEYIQNKYLVLGDLRRQQKQWFDILKKFDDKKFLPDSPIDEVDALRREVWGYYIEAKTNREQLQAEIDKTKDKTKDKTDIHLFD